MTRTCSVCHHMFQNDDEIIAVVRVRFHTIPSARSYSITKPTECLDLRHSYCSSDLGEDAR